MRFDCTNDAVCKNKGCDLEGLDRQKNRVGEIVTLPGTNWYVLTDRETFKGTSGILLFLPSECVNALLKGLFL